MERRKFLNTVGTATLAALVAGKMGACNSTDTEDPTEDDSSEKSKVFITKEINPLGLMAVYQALERTLPEKVAVKISTGEPGGHYA